MMIFKIIYRLSQATNAEIVWPKAESLWYMGGMPKHVSKVKDGMPYGEINNSKADQEKGLEIDPVDRITGSLYVPCPLAYLPLPLPLFHRKLLLRRQDHGMTGIETEVEDAEQEPDGTAVHADDVVFVHE